MKAICTAYVALYLCTLPRAEAQSPAERFSMSRTLREAVLTSGFGDAVSAEGARDLDRPLTSSSFTAASDSFVAGYYFVDELSRGQALGPLHVSWFHRQDRLWVHAPKIDDYTIIGSVLGIQITDRYILVDLHGSPSAGQGLVLERPRLQVAATVSGYGLHMLTDGSLRYFGSMVHFAPNHQERLMIFDPSARKETEIFPGLRESGIAMDYRRAIKEVYARLPESKKDEYRLSTYGAVDDFDRALWTVKESDDGARLAFVVSYDCDRFKYDVPHPSVQTIVRCDRQAVGAWSCNERELRQTGIDVGVPLTRDPNGRYEKATLDALVQAVLDRP